jgi:hypothetical protein
MKLIPVIAFDLQYFADTGIAKIDPYQKDCWLCEVSKFTPEMVNILLSAESEMDYGTLTTFDRVMWLDGGYILKISETVEILPRCCSDLRNIEGWEEAANWKDSSEMLLWIGHPSLLVSAIDSQYLLIREEDPAYCVEPTKIKIDRSELKSAIIDARQQLKIFERMIELKT